MDTICQLYKCIATCYTCALCLVSLLFMVTEMFNIYRQKCLLSNQVPTLCAIHSPAQLYGTASRQNINLYCLQQVALRPFTDTFTFPLCLCLWTVTERPQNTGRDIFSESYEYDQQLSDFHFRGVFLRSVPSF